MKYYLISIEIAEGYPDYKFTLKARTEEHAKALANVIAHLDYGDATNADCDYEFSISANEIKEEIYSNKTMKTYMSLDWVFRYNKNKTKLNIFNDNGYCIDLKTGAITEDRPDEYTEEDIPLYITKLRDVLMKNE